MFIPRLTAPKKDNIFYYSNKNIFFKCGYGMPNCTAYSHGRFMEITGMDSGCRGNAGGWIEEAKKKGKFRISATPELGAIIVWKNPNTKDGGHVGSVEEIKPNSDIVCSNSAYKGTNFYTQTYSGGKNYKWKSNLTGKVYEFQGFILPPMKLLEKERWVEITAGIQFRKDAHSTKRADRIGTIKKGEKFYCNGNYEIVAKKKWVQGTYNGIEGWICALHIKDIANE